MSLGQCLIRSLAALFALCCAASVQAEDGFVSLFDGKSLNGWAVDAPYAANFTVQDGVLRVQGQGGWLHSVRRYSDFTLRVQLRYLTEDPGGGRVALSGIFLRSPGTASYDAGWPDQSAEVQLGNRTGFRPALPGDARWSGAVLLHGLEGGPTTFDTAAAMRAYGKTGEWQTVEIQAVGETITVSLNGHFVGRASTGDVRSGLIGIQAESGITEIRSIEIQEGVRHSAPAHAAGFTPIFDGQTLTGWKPANPASQTFTAAGGAIKVTGRAGRGDEFPSVCKGNLFSEQQYGNFLLHFQARFAAPLSDSGLLIRVPVEDGSPARGRAYQIQLQGMGDMSLPWNGAFFRQGDVPQGVSTFDFAAAKRAYSPVGQWTDYEVEAYKTWVTVRINGVVVARAENVGLPQGLIGIQCEVGLVELRNLELKELAD